MGLTLLAQVQLLVEFWLEAFQTACYLINRLPTPVLSNKSPFQVLFNKKKKQIIIIFVTLDVLLSISFYKMCFPRI